MDEILRPSTVKVVCGRCLKQVPMDPVDGRWRMGPHGWEHQCEDVNVRGVGGNSAERES